MIHIKHIICCIRTRRKTPLWNFTLGWVRYLMKSPINWGYNDSRQLHLCIGENAYSGAFDMDYVIWSIWYGKYWAIILQYMHVSYNMPHLIWRGGSRDKIRMFIWKVLPLINAEFRQICNAGYWALTNAAKIIKRWANHSVNLNTIIRIETFINTMLSHSI